MCGIVGAISVVNRSLNLDDTVAENISDVLSHRGPDDSGIWFSNDRKIFLGQRRLSIIDLSSAGHQPMTNADQTVWIVYNGESYNHPDLRKELEQKGYSFSSQTDTEVLLHGYEEFGTGIVTKLRGMFAFAIVDLNSRNVFFARDRAGIKPLYYTRMSNTFCFASEIKALLSFPGVSKSLNEDALREYLLFGKVYAPETMFEGILKFPAGHYGTLSFDGRFELHEYWNPYVERCSFPEGADEAYFTRSLHDLLRESVHLRMMSDVPVGVFLSGGVDSTANVAFMSEVSTTPVRTFTAGFEGQETYDERHWARIASKQYRTEHTEVTITQRDLSEALPSIAHYLDEPIADPTVIPIHFLSKLARDSGTIVILNGDGGDELFCGYNKYLRYLRHSASWSILNMSPKFILRSVSKALQVTGANEILVDLFDRSARGIEFYIGSTGALKGTKAFQALLNGAAGRDAYSAVRSGMARFLELKRSDDYAEWLSYWGLRSEVEHIFLYRADHVGMANSIEIRVPFLDHHVIGFAMQMPQRLKWSGNRTKYILKRSLVGKVPDELIHRRKQGFCVPIREWSGKQMHDEIIKTLPMMKNNLRVMHEDFIRDLRTRLQHQDESGALAWNLYSLSIWYQRWFG